ncbi:MAG TPA: radical SAM protein [Candidatus Ozemobacteraceae bacterium]|nr:radical SAM protein [Candidatus Ozemobacteraceae bacterium]
MNPETIRVSYGTALVLGLKHGAQDAPPTTAYLLWDTGCHGACSFCPRANGNTTSERLSRIVWPEFPTMSVVEALAQEPRPFDRVCLQTGWNPDTESTLFDIAKYFIERRFVLSVTIHPSQTALAARLLGIGVDHVGIGLDAAGSDTYEAHKRRTHTEDYPRLLELCRAFPGRVEIHLIFGLGDTEETFIRRMDELMAVGGDIALFAFTPMHGTGHPPSLSAYRRIQAWRWLRRSGSVTLEQSVFQQGRLIDFGLPSARLGQLLGDGLAFRTSGCGACNRPYYNERPGGIMYNFPRALTDGEIATALEDLALR